MWRYICEVFPNVQNLSPSNWNLKKIFARFPCCYFVFYENIALQHCRLHRDIIAYTWYETDTRNPGARTENTSATFTSLRYYLLYNWPHVCLWPAFQLVTNFPHWTLQHTYQVHGIRTEFSIPYPLLSAYNWLKVKQVKGKAIPVTGSEGA
jgi:hypothetical protein